MCPVAGLPPPNVVEQLVAVAGGDLVLEIALHAVVGAEVPCINRILVVATVGDAIGQCGTTASLNDLHHQVELRRDGTALPPEGEQRLTAVDDADTLQRQTLVIDTKSIGQEREAVVVGRERLVLVRPLDRTAQLTVDLRVAQPEPDVEVEDGEVLDAGQTDELRSRHQRERHAGVIGKVGGDHVAHRVEGDVLVEQTRACCALRDVHEALAVPEVDSRPLGLDGIQIVPGSLVTLGVRDEDEADTRLSLLELGPQVEPTDEIGQLLVRLGGQQPVDPLGTVEVRAHAHKGLQASIALRGCRGLSVLGLQDKELVGVLVEHNRINALIPPAVADRILDLVRILAHDVLDEPRQQRRRQRTVPEQGKRNLVLEQLIGVAYSPHRARAYRRGRRPGPPVRHARRVCDREDRASATGPESLSTRAS